jgi:hypothetical protein
MDSAKYRFPKVLIKLASLANSEHKTTTFNCPTTLQWLFLNHLPFVQALRMKNSTKLKYSARKFLLS